MSCAKIPEPNWPYGHLIHLLIFCDTALEKRQIKMVVQNISDFFLRTYNTLVQSQTSPIRSSYWFPTRKTYLCIFIFLYARESWTLTAELKRRIQDMEMTCYCKILRISYKDHVTNEEVHPKIQQAIGPHEDLLTIVKRRKLQ